MLRRELALATAHEATILGNGVQPLRQCTGVVESGQVWNYLQENFLHGVLGILAVPTDSHSECKDGLLQEGDRFFERALVTFFQEFERLFDVGPHVLSLSKNLLGYRDLGLREIETMMTRIASSMASDSALAGGDHFEDRFSVVDCSSPSSAADVLQGSPDSGVVGQEWIRGKIGT